MEKISNDLQKELPFEKLLNCGKEEKEKEREKFGLKDCFFALSNEPLSKKESKYFDELGCPVVSLYGEIEASGPITFPSKEKQKQGTFGKPIEGNKIEILNADENGIGEIIVSTPSLFSSINNDPNANESKLVDGKLRTGKVGKLDEEGFLEIKGPINEQIKLEDGTIVNPKEIERELRENPFVEDAVLFGNGNNLFALLTPDQNEIEKYSKENNLDPNEFLKSPKLKEILDNHVGEVNKNLPEKQKIKKTKNA